MRTVLLVSPDEALRAQLVRALGDRSVFFAASDDEALKTLRVTQVEAIVKDAVAPLREVPRFIARARHVCPSAVVICVLPAGESSEDDESAAEAADFVLLQPFTSRHLQDIVRQAEEKLRLLEEVAARIHKGLSYREVLAALLLAGVRNVQPRPSVGHKFHAVLVVNSAHLAWLAAEGRMIQIDEAHGRPADPAAREIAREMAVLQAVVAIPLISHGELVAVLTLGQRITGGAYSRGETEILFSLGTHLATAIRDIRIHHLLQYQKEFNERILARMSNGVITIGPDETVVIMNRRAEEILGVSARDVLGKDLRVLPSPLGDLLFETLTRSRSANRADVHLALRNLPLEVSSYPVMGDGTEPLGAVLVFEDLTAQRQLAQEKRAAEQLQLLTRVVARIADEIKNPLVSVNAFMELIGERYDDPSFRHQFSSVVGRDVRRLIQIFDKLAALVNEGDYKRDIVDLRAMAEECLAEMGAQALASANGEARLLTFADESTQKHVTATLSHEGPSFLTTGDRSMLKKAIAYLVWYLLRKTPGTEAKIAVSISRLTGEDRVRLTVASRTAEVRPEELRGIFDPIQVVQENLIDVGPCVSQRIIEAQGGRLEAKQGRGEVSFTATLLAAQP